MYRKFKTESGYYFPTVYSEAQKNKVKQAQNLTKLGFPIFKLPYW